MLPGRRSRQPLIMAWFFEDVFDSSKEKGKRKENETEIGVEFERYMVIL